MYQPAGREGGVESICLSDAEPIDTVADYGILYLSLKYDKNPTGDFKFEGRVCEVVKCKTGREMMGFIQR